MRYTFRTAPLRNLKVAPAFFHNGAFGTLEAAIAHHLDVEASLRNYDPDANDVPSDLFPGPFEGILAAGRAQGLHQYSSAECRIGTTTMKWRMPKS